MAPPLIVRAVLDAAGYLKVADSVVSSNTRMAESALGTGADFTKSAEAQVAAGAKVISSQRAQLAQLRLIQSEAVAGSDRRIAADAAVAKAQASLNRSMGLSVVSTRGLSSETKVAERDLGKLSRGALAGSGLFSKLGRSLAFASTGFIAVAGGATVIAASIKQAETLASSQRQVDQQLKVSGKSWATYGTRIDSVLLKEGHLAGFTRAQLLQSFGYLLRVGGNVQRSLKLTGLAADVARGRSISLQSASLALSKALGGSATALRRLGIIVPNNVTKIQALAYVQAKFAGQAEAGTTSSQRFSAVLADAGATIGTVLLPTFERLITKGGDWITRMNESGRLEKDFSAVTQALGIAFHGVEKAIEIVDKITGGFGKTLVLIGEIWATVKITGWINSLGLLAKEWGLVESAATGAAAAEAAAIGGAGAASAAAGGAAAGGAAAAGGSSVVSRVAMYTGTGASFAAKASRFGAIALGAGLSFADSGEQGQDLGYGEKNGKFYRQVSIAGHVYEFPVKVVTGNAPRLPNNFGQLPPVLGGPSGRQQSAPYRPFGNAQPIPQISDKFTLPFMFQLKQARDALTASLADDVKTAQAIVKFTKKLIDDGNYHGQALLQLLQAEAAAQSTIDTAAQARQQAAQAKKDAALARASTYDIPGALQLADAKAQAYGKSETAILKKIIAAAERAIRSGGKNWQGLVAAYNTITSARAQLEQEAQAAIIPLRLQLALAKAQATGTNQDPILRKMKAALEKALRAAKGNIQKQIDIWNQIAAINQQLGSSITNAYGKYKKASLKWETEGLGLTPAQRRALEAKLSQIGPGGTHPMKGTGAAGYIIDPATGRPLRDSGRRQGSQYSGGGGGSHPVLNATIDLNVFIDGKQVEATVTKRQQKNNTRRPTQRRGPNAATR